MVVLNYAHLISDVNERKEIKKEKGSKKSEEERSPYSVKKKKEIKV